MKKISLVLVMFFLTGFVSSQNFIVTKNGLRASDNIDKKYIVIYVEGKSAIELYDNVMRYINKSYKHPESVIKNQVYGEHLRFKTFTTDVIKFKYMLRFEGNIRYATKLDFKDGRVRVEFPEIDIKNSDGCKLTLGIRKRMMDPGYFIWINKKGVDKLIIPDAKLQVEDYFNGIIEILTDAFLAKSEVTDNW